MSKVVPNTKKLMQDHMKTLCAKRDAIMAKSGPLREQRDKVVNDAREKELELVAKIREVEAGLYELQNEIGAVAMALGGLSVNAESAN